MMVRALSLCRARVPWSGVVMKMIKAFVKKFKQDEELAANAWPLHVI